MSAIAIDLPVVLDPFSRLGDEVAGDTPDEIALNVWKICEFQRSPVGRHAAVRRGKSLLHRAPDLKKIFRGYILSEQAKSALRKAEAFFKANR